MTIGLEEWSNIKVVLVVLGSVRVRIARVRVRLGLDDVRVGLDDVRVGVTASVGHATATWSMLSEVRSPALSNSGQTTHGNGVQVPPEGVV